ncbi:hypothetical protein NHX12_018044 [Muraenolepis orangiensis]|uniref:Uncharacterized protein n=1 Tax=Muraenolepis orangiensis TaxID=630683 RepID=A0A9Q0IV25_9TELE|nr:hypothetical protein NHX12_018044 [Muraenolepis orangiensis]
MIKSWSYTSLLIQSPADPMAQPSEDPCFAVSVHAGTPDQDSTSHQPWWATSSSSSTIDTNDKVNRPITAFPR